MKKIIALAVLLAALSSPAHATSRRMQEAPAPRLVQPTDAAVLAAEGIRFVWTSEASSTTDYYDLRIYEGVQAVESGLVLKERVPRDRSELVVPAEKFKAGQTYAWTVRVVGSRKSKPSYSIFKVNS